MAHWSSYTIIKVSGSPEILKWDAIVAVAAKLKVC